MTRENYYKVREIFGVINEISDYEAFFDTFLTKYPVFKDVTVGDVLEYYRQRREEEENRLKDSLKVR